MVVRNQAMYDSMPYLQNRLKDTDILQEYFVPKDRFVEFIDGLREIVIVNDANLLNLTVRIVHKDEDTSLPYATEEEMFGVVLYFNQKLNLTESKILEKTTNEIINLTQGVGGRFYLPYQLSYSKETLQRVYPEVREFFEAKKRYDPSELFSNTFYEKYKHQ